MDNKWNKNLTPEQNYILKEEGTEPPGSSPLNQEKREGDYYCASCGTKLFNSSMKFESGSGWPSFFSSLPEVFVKNVVVTTVIFSMMAPNLRVKDFAIMDFV